MSKDSSAEDLDEEIAQLEEELAELDASEGSKEEGEEGEKRSLKDRVPFLGTSKDETEDDEADADDAGEDADASDDEGPVGRLMGRFRSDDDEEAPEEEQASDQAEPDDDPTEETEPPSPPPEDDEPAQETTPPAAFDDDASPTDEAAGDEGRSEPGGPQEAARRESDHWVKTSEGWERRRPGEEPLAEDPGEEEGDEAGARALLSRFRNDTDDEPQEAPAGDPDDPPHPHEDDGDEDEEDEDEGRRPFLIAAWILLALLLIAALAAAAIFFTGAGEDIEAQLSSDAIEQDGVLVAATGAPILFDASDSTGTVEAYQWDFGDGTETTTQDATVTHTYEERGTYTVTTTVEGNRASDEATRDVRVVDAPEAAPNILLDGTPVVEPGEIGSNVFLGERVTLDASGSTADADQEITSYEWDVTGDGSPDTTGVETTTTFDEAGAWEVLLTVTDDVGHTGTATRVVHVGDVHRFENETMPAPSPGTEEQTETHETGIDMARLGVQPIQIEAVLTYGPGGEDEGPVDPSLEPDLDLSVTSPDGESYQAEDDEGTGGEESLTLTGGDIDSLGTWSWEVTRDVQGGLTGGVSEVEYTLVVHVYY